MARAGKDGKSWVASKPGLFGNTTPVDHPARCVDPPNMQAIPAQSRRVLVLHDSILREDGALSLPGLAYPGMLGMEVTMRLTAVGLLSILLALSAAPYRATEVFVTAPQRPEILDRQDLPESLAALAISPDGSSLAYALASAKREGSSDIVWVGASTATVTVAGSIRDLVFVGDGSTLVGLQHRPAKKSEGDTFLFAWGGEPKVRRVMRVPPSSNDLDRWPGGDALLLACRNEIRTILLPDFRSGPLFSFPGDNFALTSLAQSSYVVVGQPEGLFLLDLSVPSGRESMPVLASQALPGRVAELADDPAGNDVILRLIDGRLFRASFDPTALELTGSADRLAGTAKATENPVFSMKVSEPAIVKTAAPTETPPPAPPVATEAVTETPVAQPDSPPQAEPSPTADAPSRQLQGHIGGNASLVDSVVLLGPDNILREAARVRLDDAGDWSVDGLSPGRYRIQLDGGGTRVLVAEPQFLMVDVGTSPARAPEIKVLRSF
jgi:hypothetical protein